MEMPSLFWEHFNVKRDAKAGRKVRSAGLSGRRHQVIIIILYQFSQTIVKKGAKMPLLKIDLPKDYSTREHGISQSIMSGWGCRRKMLFILNRWTAANKTGTFFGTAFHDSFEAAYKDVGQFNPKLFAKYLSESQLREMKKISGKEALDKLAYDYRLMSIVFPEYFAFYQKADSKRDWFKLEAAFNYLWTPLGKSGPGWRLRGKVDGIFKDKKGKYWIVEHKTKSRIDEETLQKVLTFNFQNLFYILACERELNIPIAGVLYDIIRKPGEKQKVNEPDKDFAARLVKEIQKEPKYYFKRMELIYSKAERDEFENELAHKLEELDELISGRLPVYRNECLCEHPFPCQFLDACASGTFSGLKQKETLFEELVEE